MALEIVDLVVIVAVMVAVTWLGHRLSGSIHDRRSFFQADGSLPWWAVSASIIATLVSAVTFISVPAAVFAVGGNLTYVQVILSLALGKIAVGLLLAEPFYKSDTVNTTYEYIGARIDRPSGEVSMYLGLLLNVINSGVKLLTASLVLDVITAWGLPWCALFVVAISVLWCVLAGIKTDFLLFVLFSVGAVFVLIFLMLNVDQSLTDAVIWLDDQAKLALFDFSTDPAVRYTIWAGVIGGIALNVAQGSTRGTWQRVKACRSAQDAKKAYNFAALFYVMHIVILGVGLGLSVFYAERGVPEALSAALQVSPDRIFPHFIVTEIPVGISGFFIAAIFAAAISTLDLALAESSDLTIAHIYSRYVNKSASERHYLFAARVCLVAWGLVFFGVALFFSRYSDQGLLDLTFKLPNYIYGAIFGSIVLARFGIGRFRSFACGFVVACSVVGILAYAGVAFFYWCPVAGLAMVLVVWAIERTRPETSGIAV